MKGFAYCTAASYPIKRLFERLRHRFDAKLIRDVICLSIPQAGGEPGFVFYFPFGVTICWALTPEECKQFLDEVAGDQEEPVETIEKDEFSFGFGESAKMNKEEIVLPNREPMTFLAVSHALAQSIKLSAFETAIRRTFNTTSHIPADLAKHGKIVLSRREIRRKMGQLFIERNSINLQCDVLDTPEFFWENPELEPLYMMVGNHLDLENRVQVLNQRLDIVHELFDMLGNELNHQHSSRLEMTIITLICIEVGLTLLRDFLNIL